MVLYASMVIAKDNRAGVNTSLAVILACLVIAGMVVGVVGLVLQARRK